MSDLDPLGSMVVRIIPGIKWVYDNPPPVANLALAKEVGNNVQRSLYFHVSASEPFRVFHGVLQCQIYDGIRRQKEEAQMLQTSCECRRYQPRCENNEETLHPLLPTSWYTAVLFPHRGGFKGMVAQFRLVDFMCIVYMPRTQLTSIFEGTQPSKTRPFSSIKTRGPIWVLILFPMFSTAKLLVLDEW